ncbi:ParB/RepB/Spo0J family partition protein [Nitrosotalea sinensis]|nr:ParB N-terminal domain-containing protein [Candidatus Nitrosotalea sinensis]
MILSSMPSIYEGPKEVALKDLQLDSENVRFKHLGTHLTESQIEEWLYDEEDVRALMKQILRDKGILQPLYVKQKNGKYVVKEGNRRTTALRRISKEILLGKEKGFEKHHFEIVPVMVLKGTDREIDIFLGSIHVSGPKAWAAANKAGHIFDLVEKHGESFQSIAEDLAMTKKTVMNYYHAFKATQTYGKRHPEDKNYLHKYSFFAELYSSKILTSWVSEDPSRLDYFIDLIASKKFTLTYKDVRTFAKIIATPNPKSSQALAILDAEDGNIEKAYAFLTESQRNLKVGPWKDLESILQNLKQLPFEEFLAAIEDRSKQKIVEEVANFAGEMQERIKEELDRRGVTPI